MTSSSITTPGGGTTIGQVSAQDVARAAFRLAASYPETDLGNPPSPLDDLIYIVLSGQTNENNYQSTFAALKAAYPGWEGLSSASDRTIAKLIQAGGLAQQKAAYLKNLLRQVEKDFGRPSLDALFQWTLERAEKYLAGLPGVGIKSARCVLVYALHRDVFPADVNCLRLMERLGWVEWRQRRAESLAAKAQDIVPPPLRRTLHIGLIQHGRSVCTPQKQSCGKCCLADLCSHIKRKAAVRPAVVDLCCGAGGFSWGFIQAGFDVVLGVDHCEHALETYAANIPGAKTLASDITDEAATLRKIKRLLGKTRPRVVIAGPPCQGFSRAGPRDAADPRNAVLRASMKLAVALRPDVIVVENVLNVRAERFVHHFDKTMGVARRAGYCFANAVLRAEAFGVPQSRKRVVLVATRVADGEELLKVLHGLEARPVVEGMTVGEALRGVPPEAGNAGRVANHDAMEHGAGVVAKIKRIAPGEGPLPYRKLHPGRLAPTLICGHRALPCHYAAPRTITAREAARIQGFPDEFRFAGPRGNQMLQVANAVPPRVSLGVAVAILPLLGVEPPPELAALVDRVLRRMIIAPATDLKAAPAEGAPARR